MKTKMLSIIRILRTGKSIHVLVKILLMFIFSVSIYYLIKSAINHDVIEMFIVWMFMGTSVWFIQRKCKVNVGLLFLLAVMIRVVFCVLWNIEMNNDFKLTYDMGYLLAHSPVSTWKETLTYTYTDVFSYIVPYIIYEALIIKLFGGGAIIVLHGINILVSAATCVLIYKITKGIFGDKAGKIAAFFQIFNPTVLFFMSVLTSQHISVFLLLLGLYIAIFLPIKNKSQVFNYIVAGSVLAFSALFRNEITVINIAIVCMIVYKLLCGNLVKEDIKNCVAYFLSYFIVLIFINVILVGGGIVNKSILNNNMEYRLLVGTNFESKGCWNYEDAAYMDADSDVIMELVKERLNKNVYKVGMLLRDKINILLGSYTNYSCFGNFSENKNFFQENIMPFVCDAYMLVVQFFMLLTVMFSKIDDKRLFFLYIVTLGLCMAYLVIEVQNRYSYVITPFITIFSSYGAVMFTQYVEKVRNKSIKKNVDN